MPHQADNKQPLPDSASNIVASAELMTYIDGVVKPALVVARAEDALGTDKTRVQSFEEREARIYGQEDLALIQRLIKDGVLTDPRFREGIRKAQLMHRAYHNQIHGPLDSEPPK